MDTYRDINERILLQMVGIPPDSEMPREDPHQPQNGAIPSCDTARSEADSTSESDQPLQHGAPTLRVVWCAS